MTKRKEMIMSFCYKIYDDINSDKPIFDSAEAYGGDGVYPNEDEAEDAARYEIDDILRSDRHAYGENGLYFGKTIEDFTVSVEAYNKTKELEHEI